MQVHQAGGLGFECLEQRHFDIPRVVETYPYEALSVCQHPCAPFCPASPSWLALLESSMWLELLLHVALCIACALPMPRVPSHARVCLCSMLSYKESESLKCDIVLFMQWVSGSLCSMPW